MDLLDALTRNFLGTNVDEEELADLKPTGKIKKCEEKIVISNTMQRQREHYAARVLTQLVRRVAHDPALRLLWRETREAAQIMAAEALAASNIANSVDVVSPNVYVDVQATSQIVIS